MRKRDGPLHWPRINSLRIAIAHAETCAASPGDAQLVDALHPLKAWLDVKAEAAGRKVVSLRRGRRALRSALIAPCSCGRLT